MNYQEWKKSNTHKSINDYFVEFPEKKSQLSSNYQPNPTKIITPIVTQVKTIKSSKPTDLILILASILIIVAFFLPWINIKILSLNLVSSSGSDLPNILSFVYPDSPQIERFGKIIYLIPIGALLVLVGEASKTFFLKAIGSVSVLITSSIWFYTLYSMFNYAIDQFGLSVSITNFYTIGMYLTLAGSLYYLFDILKSFFD